MENNTPLPHALPPQVQTSELLAPLQKTPNKKPSCVSCDDPDQHLKTSNTVSGKVLTLGQETTSGDPGPDTSFQPNKEPDSAKKGSQVNPKTSSALQASLVPWLSPAITLIPEAAKKLGRTYKQTDNDPEQSLLWDTGWVINSGEGKTLAKDTKTTKKELRPTLEEQTPYHPEQPPQCDTGWKKSELTLGGQSPYSPEWLSYWDNR